METYNYLARLQAIALATRVYAASDDKCSIKFGNGRETETQEETLPHRHAITREASTKGTGRQLAIM